MFASDLFTTLRKAYHAILFMLLFYNACRDISCYYGPEAGKPTEKEEGRVPIVE